MENKQIKIITTLTFILSISLMLVSYFGVFFPRIYERDSISMGVQGMGQDIVNHFLVVPLLIISLIFVRKGNKYSYLIFSGILFYIYYSFIIYCFGVHFNNLFLFYCLILGTSLYTFIIIVIQLSSMDNQNWFSNKAPIKALANYFIVIAAMFYLIWLKDVVPAILSNTIPRSISDNKLLVNPVHVLDISITLPGLIITAMLLIKKHKLGYIFTPIYLVFIILLAIALIGMVIMLKIKGLNDDISVSIIFSLLAVISSGFLVKYFRAISI